MILLLQRFVRDEAGATAIEYGLIAALVALGIVVGVGNAADAIKYMWGNNNSKSNTALDMHNF